MLPFITMTATHYFSLIYFCYMQIKYFSLLLIMSLLIITDTQSQQKWDLRRCVDYAVANNISVKQTDITAKIAELDYKQSRLSGIPSLSFSTNPAFSSGRNQDPSSYSLITESYFSASMQLQSSVEIFSWFSKRNTIAANEMSMLAARASTDKLKDDISLSVANAYLQVLLTKEQEKIALVQLQQSQSQLANTRKQVNAGALPELNAAEMETQVATDSFNYISAVGNVTQSILNLKAYMSIDAGIPFEVETPPVDLIPLEKIADLQPEAVYLLALANLPQQRVNDFKLKSAIKTAAAMKGNMYPTVSAFGSLSSNYVYSRTPVYEKIPNGYVATGLKADAGNGVYYDVLNPVYINGNRSGYSTPSSFGSQLDQNFRQSIGISISVPIFSGRSLRTNWEKSRFNLKSLQYQKDADNLKLKQDIYLAFNYALTAMEKFNASKKTVETAKRSFDFAQKRYDIGMLSVLELITSKNNLLKAKLEYVQNQFDYVFKMKVLEYYKGQGIKL